MDDGGECALELDDSWSVTAPAAHASWPVHDRRLFNLMVLDNLFSSLFCSGYIVRKSNVISCYYYYAGEQKASAIFGWKGKLLMVTLKPFANKDFLL